MSRPRPLHWLSEHAGTGLKELPSNTAWLLSRALPSESESSVVAGTRDRARKVRVSIADATPMGDSVETRMKRARAAAERAAEAEDAALQAAEQAKTSAEYAARVTAENRTRIAELKRELDRDVEKQVAEARRAADERVEQQRSAARQEADEEFEKQQRDAQSHTEKAQQEAEEDQERARELVAEATEQLAEARQLAEEATRAARAAAEEAHRQAEELADDAEQQALEADAKVAASAQIGREAETTAKGTARQLLTGFTNGDLGTHTRSELLELAAAIDIDGRATMTEAELVSAIEKASRPAR